MANNHPKFEMRFSLLRALSGGENACQATIESMQAVETEA
jgi:hypothetical protein